MSTKRKTKVAAAVAEVIAAPQVIHLDLGCGKNKKEGFIGVDQFEIPGVDAIANLGYRYWKFDKNRSNGLPLIEKEWVHGGIAERIWTLPDNSIEEVNCTHFIEHLTNFGGKWERVHFFNELHRVMKPGAKCNLVFPHWASNRYYGDPTHCEPFSEMGFYYLSRAWRLEQTPAVDISYNADGYSCDFECTWGYSMHPTIVPKNSEYQQFALQNFKEAAQDIIANLVAKK